MSANRGMPCPIAEQLLPMSPPPSAMPARLAAPSDPSPASGSLFCPETIADAIRSGLLGSTAEQFADVTLIARDGGRVPAVRALLAVRSAYFRARFFTGYTAETAKELPVPAVSTPALRHVVHFAYTDDAQLFRKAAAAVAAAGVKAPATHRRGRDEKPLLDSADVVTLVDLVTAADYFQMPALASKAGHTLVSLLNVLPRITCVVMEAASRHPALDMVTPQVMRTARAVMRRSPQDCLLVDDFRTALRKTKTPGLAGCTAVKDFVDSGVLMLRADTLETILSDDDLFTSETYLFQVLYYWATDGLCLGALKSIINLGRDEKDPKTDVGKEDTKNVEMKRKPSLTKRKQKILGKRKARESVAMPTPNAAATATATATAMPTPTGMTTQGTSCAAGTAEESRWAQAKRLVRHINLERLKPSFVRDYVEASGLLGREGILRVYQQQALEAERGRALYDSFRGGSVWANGTKTLTEGSSGEYRSRALESPRIKGGRHEWRFRVEVESECTWIGVASGAGDEAGFFGNCKGGWAYATQGTCTQDGRMQGRRGPTIAEGETVKMILNLTRSGTMTIVAEGSGKVFRAFGDMVKEGDSFVPVVCLKRPARITLVSEKHTMD